ncbi:MAG: hypothetical protein K2N35_02115 [Muribaculaceae bacterium]|nr:hypothetical protein [Muribaculaceae bacterium]
MKKILLLLMTIFAAYALHPPHARCDERKRLLIINSYHDGAPWAQDIINPVLYDISKRDNFYAPQVIYLSNTLIHNDEDFKVMEDGLFRRFSDKKPDYLVLVGNFSFTLRDRIVKEWGNVPMLLICQSELYGSQEFYYTNVSSESEEETLRPLQDLQGKFNFSIVHIPNLYEQTIDLMRHLFPEMHKLVFVADGLYVNRHLDYEIRSYIKENYRSMEYEWLLASDSTSEQLQQYLLSKDYNTGLLLSTWFYERMTIHGYPQLIAGDAHLIKSVRHPVFGLREAYFSYGIAGGVFPSPEEFSDDLKEGLSDLVSGADMSNIPFRRVEKKVTIVNYEKLQQCGVSEKDCPSGTVFINKPKTLWEEYYVTFIFAIIAVAALTIVGIVTLFFQRRKIEILDQAKEKAMESDKLKMAFLANMSHEIRTPLNAIVGFSRLLPKTKDPEKQARFVETINMNNELLLKLIGDVLDTAKIESNTLDVHKEQTDVNKVMESAESTVRFRLRKGVGLILELGQADCIIFTDSVRLRQVLVNLLTNAIKFTEVGCITFGYQKREGELYFYVRDTGKGIAPEDQKQLFTRFKKLNNFAQGNGLGLSISKSIVELLGGRIGVESEGLGKGSLFWFTLPWPG